MNRDIENFAPRVLVVDPISAFRGPATEIHATLIRLADICKTKGITALFTSLSSAGANMDESARSVSSLMDTWLSLMDVEANGERNRVLYLLKSRGMNHSNQLREYVLSSKGVSLTNPYVGSDGVLTGTARVVQEAREKEREVDRHNEMERRKREIQRRRLAAERQIEEMRAAIEAEEAEVATLLEQEGDREGAQSEGRERVASRRGAVHD
jgi:circadian clock protein KaiC